MENTWKLTKIEPRTTYTVEHLTIGDVLLELYYLIGYAHHGCLKTFSRSRDGLYFGLYDFGRYVFVCDFGDGEEVTYIFEREGDENEKDTIINSN